MSAAARWRALALLAAIFGVGVSAYLLVEYTTGRSGVCLTGSGCDEVRASEFAYPLGIPLPLFGVAFFAAAAWIAYRTLSPSTLLGLGPRAALLLVGAVGAAVSAALTGLEAFVIGAFCTWCLASAAASAALLVAAIGLSVTPDPEPLHGSSSRARSQRARTDEAERGRLRRVGTWSAAATAALFVGLLVAGAAGAGQGSSGSGDDLAPAGSPRLGNGPVTVVEFADFQCPGCAVIGPILQSMAVDNEFTLVFRHFPLEAIHANANAASRAVEAAGAQGGFWSMAELLYVRQDQWKNLSSGDADGYFAAAAGEIGLDVSQWTVDYDSATVRGAVAADAAAARDLNLPGTPSIFIDGEAYDGELNAAAIRAAVAAAAARQSPGG